MEAAKTLGYSDTNRLISRIVLPLALMVLAFLWVPEPQPCQLEVHIRNSALPIHYIEISGGGETTKFPLNDKGVSYITVPFKYVDLLPGKPDQIIIGQFFGGAAEGLMSHAQKGRQFFARHGEANGNSSSFRQCSGESWVKISANLPTLPKPFAPLKKICLLYDLNHTPFPGGNLQLNKPADHRRF